MKNKLYIIIAIFLWTVVINAQINIGTLEYAKSFDSIDTIKVNDTNDSLYLIIRNKHYVSFDQNNYPFILSKIDLYNKKTNSLIQTILDTSYYAIGVLRFEDINFDGYKDIIINKGGVNLTLDNYIWLFNEYSKKYSYSFYLNDYYINKKDTTIESYTYETLAKGGTTDKYKVINNKLVLVEHFRSFDNLDGTVDYLEESYVDGTLRTILSVVFKYDLNDRFNTVPSDTAILEFYSKFYDSLMIDSKIWMKRMNFRDTVSNVNLEFYICIPEIDCYKYFKKEKYRYSLINRKIVVDTLIYENINNKWLRIR